MSARCLFGWCARIALPFIIFAAIVWLLAGPAALPALGHSSTAAGRNGEIVFVRDHLRPDGGGNGYGIFVVDPDGSYPHWFFADRGYDASWSPNGKRLLFDSSEHDCCFWIADQFGQHAKRVLFSRKFSYPDWSPDGKRLVFLGPIHGLIVAQLIGTRLRHVRQLIRGYADDPAWSPARQEIVVVRYRHNATALVRVGVDDAQEHVMIAGRGFSGPSWSPDGAKIAFIRCTTGHGNRLSVIRRDGSGLHDLLRLATPGTAEDSCVGGQVAWSPDGKQITFIASGESGARLQMVAADGTNRRTIYRDANGCCRITWQKLP